MRANEFVTERKKHKRKSRYAAYGPGPYGGYGYYAGYSGDSSGGGDAGGDGGGGGESIKNEDAMMAKIEGDGKIVRILKKAHTVPFSDEKNWLLIDTDPGKGNKGLGIKWIPADTKFTWVRPYRDTVDENTDNDAAKEYRAHLIKTLPQIMKLFANIGKGWIPSKEQMLNAVDTAYRVMKHTGDAKQAGKVLMDELNALYRMSKNKQDVAEARTSPDQNTKPESGMKELQAVAETITDPENWAISMTAEPKLGINPQVGISEDTPKGIYFYPLDYTVDLARRGKKLPWGDNLPYIQLFQYDRSGEMTKETQVDPARLKQALGQYCPAEVIQQAIAEPEYDGTPYWTIYDCLSRLGKSDETNVVRWNKVLRDLGFTSVFDPGAGWIAYGEPTQGVVLDPRIIKQHKTITNKQKSRVVTPAVIEKAIFDTLDIELAANRAWQAYDPDGSKLRVAAKEYAKKPDFKQWFGKPGSEEIFDKAASWGRYGARELSQTAWVWYKEQQAQNVAENFADGKNPQDKGDSKRHGVPTKASVSTLRKVAKQGGRKGQLAHWMANMKSGRSKKK